MVDELETLAIPRFALMLCTLMGSVFAAVVLLVWFVNPFRVPGTLQVLDRISLRNGSELLLVQRYNGSIGEPSTITVYHGLLNG